MSKRNENIPILNIYYMIAYAYAGLEILDDASVSAEEFENATDMLAFVFAKCLGAQIRRGLERGYIEVEDDIAGIRGRLDVLRTMQPQNRIAGRAHCSFEEMCPDTPMNRILRKTLTVLLAQPDVKKETKQSLRALLPFFNEVAEITDVRQIQWGRLSYHRNNKLYRFLMNLCYLILHELILTESDGELRLQSIEDSQKLHHLYERFIYGYFKAHHSRHLKTSSDQLVIDDSEDAPSFLPVLQTDIVLSNDEGVLVIDAKYYTKTVARNYSKDSFHAANINQIFHYVMLMAQRDDNAGKAVSGMLLYAKTKDTPFESEQWEDCGHAFEARTLDLGVPFDQIRTQLDAIAEGL